MKVKNIFCEICSEDKIENFTQFLPNAKVKLVKCNSCGFVFIPQNTRNKIEYSNYRDEEVLKSVRAANNYVRFRRHKLRIKLIKKFKNSGNLFDIGVGWGHFAYTAKKMGFDVDGIEISETMHHYATNDLNLRIEKGSFYEIPIKENFYDIITLWDVLEHLEKPLEVLKKANRMLKDDGIIVIQVPQIDSKVAKIQKEKWPMLSVEHINYFSKSTIKLALEKSGFKILKFKTSYELKLFLMFTVLPLLKRKKNKSTNIEVSISGSERQNFFNKFTNIPKPILLLGLFVHDVVYYLLSWINFGEEIIVIARKQVI
ncbi:MAG: class I SAM-dependent methyltransferase [Bacteroidales bacterium]|jgi:2-polyprenyl-3-methyl-5-hydroxy-6-metoxy-1,4-benzoquinol methylase|nr:class I SAM-dependent methyltransferase [Bacteroidales bacterium]HOL97386.1 class I SAM-dependent methyltransferase [Bacteroidales bacterium]HOM36117.1 class I SAM-dependent methyltransferase [Bacteroidales bacterium]HPD22953.1 class I SAM-dependent methyltransferase [Bacteroidales bacterium]HRS98622.1 class I SAM-dependent methyltransferase [Bacteroidales bacterium]